MFDYKLEARLDDLAQFACVGVVFRIRKATLEKAWGHVYEPKTPCFCSKFRWAGSKRAAEIRRNILHSVSSLLPYLSPNVFRNLVVLRAGVEALELAGPVLDKIGYEIFEKEMHKIPWI